MARFLSTPAVNIKAVPEIVGPKGELSRPPVEPSAEPAEQGFKPHLVSISPYEIKRIVDSNQRSTREDGNCDLRHMWNELDLKARDDFEASLQNCDVLPQATIYKVSISTEDHSSGETVLELVSQLGTLYWFFEPTRRAPYGEWTLIGSVPYPYDSRFGPIAHRIASDGKHHWFAISYESGHGSGYGLRLEDWYEAGETGVTRVLSYQTGLFLGYGHLGIDSKTKLLRVTQKGRVATVTLLFANSFEAYDRSSFRSILRPWTTKRTVTYVKRDGSPVFVLDPQNSEMSEEELRALSDFDSHGDDDYSKDILRYNYPELAVIASGKGTKRKEWLRDFLASYDDSAEKRLLSRALESGSHK